MKYTVFGVPADCTVKYRTFHILPETFKVSGFHRMVDALYALFDDGALVKVHVDIMRRGADQFDTSFKGLVIRTGAFETR